MKLTLKPVSLNHILLLFAALSIVTVANAADYPSTVLGDNPIAYYRFEETSGTTVADSSASGAFPATYFYSTDNLFPELGQPGIDTNSFLLSAADPAFVYSGYYPEFNEQAPFSFEIWARPTSVDPNNYRCPVGNFSGWVAQPSGWYIYQTPGTPSSSTFAFITASGVWITYTGITPGNWYHLVGTYDGTNCSFYVNGTLVGTEAAPGYLANSTANSYNSLGIGERGDDSQFFDGNLDEFAYYTNALTAAQVLNHYQIGTNSFRVANSPPSILQDVVSSVNAYAGHTVQFSVLADGTGSLAYQWYKGATAINGATSNVLAFTCAPADDGTTYYVHISNAYGSTNSSTATLSVSTGLEIDAPLTSITRNAGSAAAFEIVANGALPINYQWHNGDSSSIAGATNSILWLSNVQSSNNGASYYVTINNPYTSTNSIPAVLNVQTRAVNVPITKYAKVVVADGPVAYWRLDESSGSTTAVDAVGSFDGIYTNNSGSFTFDVPTGIPNETDGAIGIANGATVSIPYAIEINPLGAFTVEGWFQPASVTIGGNDYRTAISSMSNPYGIGPTGWLVYQTAGNNWAWWPYNGFYNGIQLTDYDQVVANEWYYLAMVYDGTNFTFYVNGVAEASGTDSGFVQNGNVPSGGVANYNYNYNSNSISGFPTSEAFTIGQRVDDAFNPFEGTIDDVAVYDKALTPQQIQNHFLNTTHLVAVMSGNNIIITWGTGTLQSATNVNGPYTDVSGASAPSYTNSVSGTQQLFYRVQLQ
ncbi:MAG TPA: LamG domain-containing protein [Verrucomicrobiae bacterium]|nr:LamG domain-containing protein [Verrucomicrobiae bacterium]